MEIKEFIDRLRANPGSVEFGDAMSLIDEHFHFTPMPFKNGEIYNEVGQNNGSCKLLAFCQLHNLTKEETLDCFGSYYREEVLLNPTDNNHLNIRSFMMHGWEGVEFRNFPLKRI